jgi:hypothetical protein
MSSLGKEGGEGRSQLGGQWKEKEKLPMLGGQWKEKEKLPNPWWSIKGEGKPPYAWWPMEGEGETPQCLVVNGKRRRSSFHLFSFSPQQILLKPSFFPLILNFYFTMVLGHYLCISSLFINL